MLNLCSFYRCLGLGRVKIILHRIISVVWLTNFPSEIRRLTSPRWWAVPLFPEREKARGPAVSWEPRIDDRLSLPRASTKEKMPAEWLLYFKMGSLKILLIQWTLLLLPGSLLSVPIDDSLPKVLRGVLTGNILMFYMYNSDVEELNPMFTGLILLETPHDVKLKYQTP